MVADDRAKQTHRLISAALALVTLALYLPALRCGFVEYDDQQYVTDNPIVQAGLTVKGLVWAFGFHAGNWHPLAWLSHMFDCQLYGAWAGGHHLTSVLLHVATTVLLFEVLRRMTGSLWRSAAVAALFAWHPLHVESVAWVSERKDVLCAFFWMLTLLAYARHNRMMRSAGASSSSLAGLKSPSLWLAFLLFVFALMAKPMAVTLPFVLLLLDFWPLNRLGTLRLEWRRLAGLLVEKTPFFAVIIAGCLLTLHAQRIAIVSTAGLGIPERLGHALVAYGHYLLATCFPYHLAVYYPYEISFPIGIVAGAGALLAAITVWAIVTVRRRPYLITGWLWYLGTLIPVIGLVQVGDQAWADRYMYLPAIGLFVPLVWLFAEIIRQPRVVRFAAAIAALALLAATSLQISYWKNTWTLFDHANKVTRDNYMAITVLASHLAQQGKMDEAMQLYHTALSYKPTFPEAHFFLGNAFDQAGRLDEAVAEYEKALWFKPTQEQTHIFLGLVLAKQNKYAAAIMNYEAAIAINPDSAPAHNNLARLLHIEGHLDEARGEYLAALNINPKLALAHNNLGILLLQIGKVDDGAAQLQAALALSPTNHETQFNLALARSQQQRWDEATNLLAKITGAGAADPKIHQAYGTALAHLKQTRLAMSEYASALLLQPDFPDALDGLAWILGTSPQPEFRNGGEAIKIAERACALTKNDDANKLKTLAAAYAETGRFSDAIKTIRTASNLAASAGNSQLTNQLSLMGAQFEKSAPWRE